MLDEFFPLKRTQIHPGPHRLSLLMQEPEGQKALKVKTCLVVGTNGKGTMCRLLESEIAKAGLSSGVYSSPHFISPLERIRINQSLVSEKTVLVAKQTVSDWKKRHLPDASFFEITTAIALLCFSKENVDIAIVEAGLGAKLDSTNALSPLVSVLVSVGLDHTDRLGTTLQEIAADKSFAGRRNRTLICGPLSKAANEGVKNTQSKVGFQTSESIHSADLSTGFDIQSGNVDTARRSLCELAKEWPQFAAYWLQNRNNFEQRAQKVKIPGRFDLRTIGNEVFLFDTAHNPAACNALVQRFQKSELSDFQVFTLFGSLCDKDYESGLKVLEQISDQIQLSTFEHEQSLGLESCKIWASGNDDSSTIKEASPSSNRSCKKSFGGFKEGIELAKAKASSKNTLTLVTGSFAFVGSVMKELGIAPEPESKEN